MLHVNWYKRHWSKYREWKNFTLSFGRLRQRMLLKFVQHVQHDYFSSFNQSDHCFLTSSLPLLSSLFKLPKDLLSNCWKPNDTRGNLTSSLIFPISHCEDESTSKGVTGSSVLQPSHAHCQGSYQILPECWNLLLPGQWQHTPLKRQFLFDHPEKDNLIIHYRNWRCVFTTRSRNLTDAEPIWKCSKINYSVQRYFTAVNSFSLCFSCMLE